MRNRILVTAVLMVAIGGGAAESVATSPECERWIADYRQKLAQARPVRAVETQNKRLKRYVHRQIAVMTHKPTPARLASAHDPLHPRFSPADMVKRFQVLCGDLPPVQTSQLIPPVTTPAAPVTPLAVPATPGEGTTPPIGISTPPGFGGSTPPAGGGAPPPVLPPPTGGGGGGGSTPPPDGGGGDTPPAPPVPEPSSLALLLVGGLSSAAWIAGRRRLNVAR
ncbi:MAG: PEP-CTERM sorting domain-containing protein [Terriglobus sp.]